MHRCICKDLRINGYPVPYITVIIKKIHTACIYSNNSTENMSTDYIAKSIMLANTFLGFEHSLHLSVSVLIRSLLGHQ